MKITITLIVAAMILCNCNGKQGFNAKTLENKISTEVNTTYFKNSDSIISLKDFTTFEWDKVYVFNYTFAPETIHSSIGLNYPYYQLNTRPWIFLKNDSIVYYENNPYETEKPINNKVHFYFPDSLKCKMYTIKDSLFKVEIKRVDADTKILVLHEVKP
jgi:hypothetical protein